MNVYSRFSSSARSGDSLSSGRVIGEGCAVRVSRVNMDMRGLQARGISGASYGRIKPLSGERNLFRSG